MGVRGARAWLGALAGLGLLLGGCMGGGPPRSRGEQLHLSKCGACHLRPERGRFDRAGWQTVLERHKTRFPLSDADRAQLVDFLARDREASTEPADPTAPPL